MEIELERMAKPKTYFTKEGEKDEFRRILKFLLFCMYKNRYKWKLLFIELFGEKKYWDLVDSLHLHLTRHKHTTPCKHLFNLFSDSFLDEIRFLIVPFTLKFCWWWKRNKKRRKIDFLECIEIFISAFLRHIFPRKFSTWIFGLITCFPSEDILSFLLCSFNKLYAKYLLYFFLKIDEKKLSKNAD